MIPPIRWHPISRVLGGIVGVLTLGFVPFACWLTFEMIRAKSWAAAFTTGMTIPAAIVLGRLFVLGAWRGHEPEHHLLPEPRNEAL